MKTSSSKVTISASSFFGIALRSSTSGGSVSSGGASLGAASFTVVGVSSTLGACLANCQIASTERTITWTATAMNTHGEFLMKLRSDVAGLNAIEGLLVRPETGRIRAQRGARPSLELRGAIQEGRGCYPILTA